MRYEEPRMELIVFTEQTDVVTLSGTEIGSGDGEIF